VHDISDSVDMLEAPCTAGAIVRHRVQSTALLTQQQALTTAEYPSIIRNDT